MSEKLSAIDAALIKFECFDCYDPPIASITFTCGHVVGACEMELEGILNNPFDDDEGDYVCVDCAGVIEPN